MVSVLSSKLSQRKLRTPQINSLNLYVLRTLWENVYTQQKNPNKNINIVRSIVESMFGIFYENIVLTNYEQYPLQFPQKKEN